MSLTSGNYSLTVNPAASIVDSSVWVAATHDLVFGDVLGTGSAAMLLRARGGQPSFLIVTSPSDGRPQLLQHLTVANLGIDISGSANSVALRDANQDGRADLILSTSGTMSSLLLAGTDGRFVKPQGNDSILVAWRLFCSALDSGDLTSALAQITSGSQQTYLAGLVGVGTDITSLSANWTQIKSVEVRSDYAIFSLINNYDGQRRIHTIVLVPENGRWLLEQF